MKGRPTDGLKKLIKNNNLDSDLDNMQSLKDEALIMDEDETQEAGQGTEMEFYNDEDY